MDITTNELKTMKIKQLRRLIRESVMEVIKEGTTYAGKDAVDDAQKDPKFGSLSGTGKTDAINKLKQGGAVTIGEVELDEMARIPKGFRLSDPEMNTTTYTKTISGTPLSSILDYFRQNPGADVRSIQSHFQFVRPQIANGLVKGLLDAGILTKLTAGGEVVAPVAPGEEAPVQASEPEDLFMGSSENPLSMYFDKEPNDDGSEDFNDSEEPTADELEKAEPVAGSMSDADYEAFMKYDDLKNRLDVTKANILKAKRSKGGVAGDIGDKSGTELTRLQTLKTSLEDRIDAIVSQSDYLKKRIEKLTGKAYVEPSTEPEDDTDTLDEAYDLRKLQFYAGIIK